LGNAKPAARGDDARFVFGQSKQASSHPAKLLAGPALPFGTAEGPAGVTIGKDYLVALL
jgi:hypothetical protein